MPVGHTGGGTGGSGAWVTASIPGIARAEAGPRRRPAASHWPAGAGRLAVGCVQISARVLIGPSCPLCD